MEPKNDDPTPDTPMTLDDAQYLSAKAVGYTGTFAEFMGHRTEVKAKAPPPKGPAPAPAPKPLKREDVKYGIHDPEEVGYKPMTTAKRYKGQRDIDMGKVTAGVGTGAAALASIAGNMEKVDKSITAMNPWFLIIGLVGTAIVVGAILMWHGANLKHKGREEASQPMV